MIGYDKQYTVLRSTPVSLSPGRGISLPCRMAKTVLILCMLSGWLYGQTYPLYIDQPPCPTNEVVNEQIVREDIGTVLLNVRTPELTYVAPVPRSGRALAMVIVPGGGYMVEAWDLEGIDIARYLSSQGVHCFVLRHRLPGKLTGPCKEVAALSDAQQAMRTVRELADSLGFSGGQVGIMGFSAGGHLAGSAAVHHETVAGWSSRPDFSVLVYPVTIMEEPNTGHVGSQWSLLGEKPDADRLAFYNLPDQIDSLTPPTLLVHASDDATVPVENSLRYYRGLVRHGIPADLRVYARGGHGFGAAREQSGPVSGWLDEVLRWIKTTVND